MTGFFAFRRDPLCPPTAAGSAPAQSHLRVPPSRVRAAGDGHTPTAIARGGEPDLQNALNGTSTSPCCSSCV
eukprot:7013083-Prymnesium_polylepis.1